MTEQAKSYIDKDGAKFWYLPSRGRIYYHRLDGPALELSNGTKQWWTNGKLHRSDGPAVEYKNGSKWWYVDGKLHRLDGPAVDYEDGSKWWYVDGKQHRLDGPAVEFASGTKEWWINGKHLSTEEVETWLEENNIDLSTNVGQVAFKLTWA